MECGALQRADICKAFGITPQQASADIQAYIAQWPHKLLYDGPAKCYRWRGRRLSLNLPYPVTQIITQAPARHKPIRPKWQQKAPASSQAGAITTGES